MVSLNPEPQTPNPELLKHTYGIIMAGGKGERFWPFSDQGMPKPFLNILGHKTMIQLTVDRIRCLLPLERIFIVLGKSHVNVARTQLPDLPPANFLVEPEGRDTAPCIGFAALSLMGMDPEATMMVVPSDHFVPDTDRFTQTVNFSVDMANRGEYLVTIGIKPTRPETGYGYIHASDLVLGGEKEACFKVDRFVEKPDALRAQQYLDEGKYFWNAGIFVWKAKTVLAGIKDHMPELYSVLLKIGDVLARKDRKGFAVMYAGITPKSIDYGLMEKADNVLMVPGDFTWDDVGTWSSLRRVQGEDKNGNYCSGETICLDTKNSVICCDRLKVGVIGVSNMVIVASSKGVLVCDADRAQEVREIARLMRKKSEKQE